MTQRVRLTLVGEGHAMVFARILSATQTDGIASRLREYFAPDAVDALLAARQAPIVAIDCADEKRAAALVLALAQSGCTSEGNACFVAAVATRDALASARAHYPDLGPEIDALIVACGRSLAPAPLLRMRERTLDLRDTAHVMGILNATPDSFYARVENIEAAVDVARAFVTGGAAIIDIGGQSYAHWNPTIAANEERTRVVPVVEAIVRGQLDVALSIDTWKASVARAALAAGAHVINDCSGLADPDLSAVVAEYDAALVVMHIKGELNVRNTSAYTYGDAMKEIVEFLYERTERARLAGVARESIVIDPGLEFGKEPQTDLEILDRFGELQSLGYPILFASSRKSFLGRIFGRPASELLVPSLATAGLGIAAGARLLRVHDVAETVALATMYAAVNPRVRANIGWADRMPGRAEPAGNPRIGRAVER
jgi:dihydropteroate synthase